MNSGCLLVHGCQPLPESMHISRRGNLPQHARDLIQSLRGTAIEGAAVFCDLQEARHRADYAHLRPSRRPPCSCWLARICSWTDGEHRRGHELSSPGSGLALMHKGTQAAGAGRGTSASLIVGA